MSSSTDLYLPAFLAIPFLAQLVFDLTPVFRALLAAASYFSLVFGSPWLLCSLSSTTTLWIFAKPAEFKVGFVTFHLGANVASAVLFALTKGLETELDGSALVAFARLMAVNVYVKRIGGAVVPCVWRWWSREKRAVPLEKKEQEIEIGEGKDVQEPEPELKKSESTPLRRLTSVPTFYKPRTPKTPLNRALNMSVSEAIPGALRQSSLGSRPSLNLIRKDDVFSPAQ